MDIFGKPSPFIDNISWFYLGNFLQASKNDMGSNVFKVCFIQIGLFVTSGQVLSRWILLESQILINYYGSNYWKG